MSLLNEDSVAKLDAVADGWIDRIEEMARIATWGADGSRTPMGMTRLTAPTDRRVWLDHLSRQARQEQDGIMPGDTASNVVRLPVVQQAAGEQQMQESQ